MIGDTVQFWLESAGRAPLLTAVQEINLGRQIQAWLTAADPTPRQVKQGQRAKRRLIESNMRLVVAVSKKFSARIAHSSNCQRKIYCRRVASDLIVQQKSLTQSLDTSSALIRIGGFDNHAARCRAALRHYSHLKYRK